MDTPSSDTPKLQCPNCGYDLHGLGPDRDGIFRCPECGGLTDIMGIVQIHDRRVRNEKRMWIALLTCLALFAVITLTPNGWFRINETFLIRLIAGFVVSMIYMVRLDGLAWPIKCAASAVLAVLLALPRGVKPEWGCWLYPLFPAALVALHIWAADREMKRWSK